GAPGGEGDGDEKDLGWSVGKTCRGGVEIVRMKNHCHGFLECEPGLWLVFI
ncbi:unnamed protein product, partial [Choristocarpus tenellus]